MELIIIFIVLFYLNLITITLCNKNKPNDMKFNLFLSLMVSAIEIFFILVVKLMFLSIQ